jgi:hypothetical protein
MRCTKSFVLCRNCQYGELFFFNDKVKVKVKFTIKQAMKAQRGVEESLYSFLNLGTRWEWVVNATPRPFYPRGRDPVSTA